MKMLSVETVWKLRKILDIMKLKKNEVKTLQKVEVATFDIEKFISKVKDGKIVFRYKGKNKKSNGVVNWFEERWDAPPYEYYIDTLTGCGDFVYFKMYGEEVSVATGELPRIAGAIQCYSH